LPAPLIIATPEAKSATSNAIVELLDLYPTLADMCGLTIPPHVEGESLKPLLSDPKA